MDSCIASFYSITGNNMKYAHLHFCPKHFLAKDPKKFDLEPTNRIG